MIEFQKISEDKYMIKNSNNIIVSEEEKLQIEKNNAILKDFTSNECQKDTLKEIKKINKELKEIKGNGNKKVKNDIVKETK